MTTRYTDAEWATIIEATESNVLPCVSQIPKAVPPVDSPEFARTIDHTLLKIETTRTNIDALCNEARIAGFASVCVRPSHIAQACANMRGSPTRVCSVIGFPSGLDDLSIKVAEVKHCISNGAHELDIVLNRSYLKPSPLPHYNVIYNELAAIRSLAPHPTVLKLILETSKLKEREIIAACVLAGAANFDFVKTSTGYNGRGATVEDVRLMSACCDVLGEAAVGGWAGTSEVYRPPSLESLRSNRNSRDSTLSRTDYQFDGWRRVTKRKMAVKASGGIRTLDDAVLMLQAGATRLGTSGGMWIMREAREKVAWGVRRQRSKSLSTATAASRSRNASDATATASATASHARRASHVIPSSQCQPSHSHSRSNGSNHVHFTPPPRTSSLAPRSQRSSLSSIATPTAPGTTLVGSESLIAISISARLAEGLVTQTTTTASRKGSTVSVAGVSDFFGDGMLNGNGVILGRKRGEDMDRPGLVTRLFSDY